jgi:acyl-[acyl-carrier-protein] desaturase
MSIQKAHLFLLHTAKLYSTCMIDRTQLKELEPIIEQAHEKHAARTNSPFNPIRELHAAQSIDDDFVHTINHIKEQATEHFNDLDELGVDYRPVLASSFLVNLLTEDNLPHYTKTIDRVAQESEAFTHWLNRWTAEEHQHGVILRDYALYSGILSTQPTAIIPHQTYHDGVTSQLLHGTEISITSLAAGFAYLSFQEGLTKVAHHNEEALLDQTGRRVVKRVAADEAHHEQFYATLQEGVLQLYPDEALVATAYIRRKFTMPGKLGIPHFDEHAKAIALAGIFNADMTREVQDKHLQGSKWNVANLTPQTDEGKKAKDSLLEDNKLLIRLQKRLEAEQDKAIENAQKAGALAPFVLGKTVIVNKDTKKLQRIG